MSFRIFRPSKSSSSHQLRFRALLHFCCHPCIVFGRPDGRRMLYIAPVSSITSHLSLSMLASFSVDFRFDSTSPSFCAILLSPISFFICFRRHDLLRREGGVRALRWLLISLAVAFLIALSFHFGITSAFPSHRCHFDHFFTSILSLQCLLHSRLRGRRMLYITLGLSDHLTSFVVNIGIVFS